MQTVRGADFEVGMTIGVKLTSNGSDIYVAGDTPVRLVKCQAGHYLSYWYGLTEAGEAVRIAAWHLGSPAWKVM